MELAALIQPLVINKQTISLRAPGGGGPFRSNVALTLLLTATRLLWTGAACTAGQGQVNMLTVEPLLANLRMLAANKCSRGCSSIAILWWAQRELVFGLFAIEQNRDWHE